MNITNSANHSADAAALGFYFQTFYALHAILGQPHDDAVVCLERLDDVEIHANGQSLLTQLKHSMSGTPVSLTLASKALWRTFKAWIDVLPRLVINETSFQLVTVAALGKDIVLGALLDENADRTLLHDALVEEAQRVVKEHQAAKADGASTTFPHADRVAGCDAFLKLGASARTSLLARMSIHAGNANITGIEDDIASALVNFPPDKRQAIARRLLEWWDLQVVFTLCGRRERFIGKIEVQQKISEIAGEIERDELMPEFETVLPPSDHQPDSMLVKQIELVQGKPSDIQFAIREEWRAREQRHNWSAERLDMAVRIDRYDRILEEVWADKHVRIVEEREGLDEARTCELGLKLLRWSHDDAYKEVQPFANNWNAPYYIRGSYQVLAINLQVGWHPEFKDLLGKAQ